MSIENEAAGKAKQVKGKIKDAVGSATDDKSMQAEGKKDKVEGKVQEKVGEHTD